MGVTYDTGERLREQPWRSDARQKQIPVVALAGNPNTGKSTVFNALTGLRQHTGNWPGKTVLTARGNFIHDGRQYTLVDLPGTYSLLANSPDEEVARDFIYFSRPWATVVVVDATCLERNLNLVLQITEITSQVVICLNLMDEARRKNIKIDVAGLAARLGVPVVPTAARSGEGLAQLTQVACHVAQGKIKPTPRAVRYVPAVEKAVEELEPKIKALWGRAINARWVALRILDGDEKLLKMLNAAHAPGQQAAVAEVWA